MDLSYHSSNESESDTANKSHSDHLGCRPGVKRKGTTESESGASWKKYWGAGLYKTKFQNSWKKTWPFLSAVKDNDHAFYCPQDCLVRAPRRAGCSQTHWRCSAQKELQSHEHGQGQSHKVLLPLVTHYQTRYHNYNIMWITELSIVCMMFVDYKSQGQGDQLASAAQSSTKCYRWPQSDA